MTGVLRWASLTITFAIGVLGFALVGPSVFAAPPASDAATSNGARDDGPTSAAGTGPDRGPVPPSPDAAKAAGRGAEEGADAGSAAGQPGPGSEPGLSEAQTLLQRAQKLRERAEGVEALTAGTLDPRVSLDALFVIDLLDADAGDSSLRALLAGIAAARGRTSTEGADDPDPADTPGSPESVEDPTAEGAPSAADGEASALQANREALRAARLRLTKAYEAFLTLPPGIQSARIAEHERRRRDRATRDAAEARARARLAKMRLEAEQIAQLLAGTLDIDLDPTTLLRVNLADPSEITGDEARLRRALGLPEPDLVEEAPPKKKTRKDEPPAELQELPPWAPDDKLAVALKDAAAALDGERLAFLSLGAAERQAVIDRHRERQVEAAEAQAVEDLIAEAEANTETLEAVETQINAAESEAAELKLERELAEAAADQAHSEGVRRIAKERARLLSVKESHALYRANLSRSKREGIEAHEHALEFDSQVTELRERRDSLTPGVREGVEKAADALYAPLRDALSEARADLGESLKAIASRDTGVHAVGDPLDELPQDIDREDLDELRAELEATVIELREIETETRWSDAERQRDDIVMLNQARLELLELGSRDLRGRMTGFGSDGVRQARKEIEQIALELRYRLLSLPRLGRALLRELESSPLPVLFAFIKLGVAMVLFRSWRRRADDLLDKGRAHYRERIQGNAQVNSLIAGSFWYLNRVRKPLELLLLFAVVYGVALADRDVLEAEILWLTALWVLVGLAIILTIDAAAARENFSRGRGSNTTAELRLRSLRLVGLTVVMTGLVLSLTEELVGRGAIHHWVWNLVWIAAFPIFLALIRWWREPVFRRIRDERNVPQNALVRWIRGNTEGWASFAAATLAGSYLFLRGLWSWILNRATSLDSTRRLLAYMFRREVARQASARREDAVEDIPLDPEIYQRFDPSAPPMDPGGEGGEDGQDDPLESIGRAALDAIIDLKFAYQGSLSAVIGERGSGKSTFLRRLEGELMARAEDYRERHPAADEALPDKGNKSKGGKETDSHPHIEYGRLTVRRIQCPSGGFGQLRKAIAASLGLSRNAIPEDIVAAIHDQSPVIFLLDDTHRLVRPAIGGLEDLDCLADFTREVRNDASWVASLGATSWRYVSRARGQRVFFDQVLELEPWTEQQLGELIRRRSAAAGVTPHFDGISIPRQFDVATVSEGERSPTELERAELGFYRILWDYSKGNPAVALHCWRESLVPYAGGRDSDEPADADTIAGASSEVAEDSALAPVDLRVRLFSEPSSLDLDKVGANIHFVLRAIVQLEVANENDLVACTQLPPAEIADALRFALSKNWVVEVRGRRYRVTWRWYRAITNMLRRQHLLVI